jgi:hypothetical protein
VANRKAVDADLEEAEEEAPQSWLDMIGDVVGAQIGRSCQEVYDELMVPIIELKSRIIALETAPQFKYFGPWKPGGDYHAGSMVSHSGSLWVARAAPGDARPGAGSTNWTLAVKRGRGA